MNKDIIYLDSNTVGISDNKGKISKRTYEDNIEDILADENKVELINEIISDLKNEIVDKKSFEWFLKTFLKCQILVFIAVVIVLIALKATIPSLIITSLLIPSLYAGALNIIKKFNNKKLNALNGKLELANKLQEEYKKDLENSLIKSNGLSKVPEEKLLVNEVASIAYSESLDDYVIEDLNNAYNDAYKVKEDKPFTRTRKKQK